MDDSELAQLERKRSELEENISQLRKSLQHWQTCELEYEGLREEIASLPDGCDTDDILSIARDFQAKLVDDKELQTIVGNDKGSIRNQGQIVGLLAKRVDYVSRNARTLEKQLSEAQKKRNALLLAEQPDYREDAGLPLADITEELDDKGNVVSSKLETPGFPAPQLIGVLQKAGLRDMFEEHGVVTTSNKPSNGVEERQPEPLREERRASITLSEADLLMEEKASTLKDSRERKPEELTKLDDDLIESERDAKGDYRNGNIPGTGKLASNEKDTPHGLAGSTSTGPRSRSEATWEGNEGETVAITNPDDTPDEAALRREMLQYGLGEVGAIVAELELEESGSNVSYDEDEAAFSLDSDFDGDDIDDEDESEDENGMVKHPAMSRTYLRKMKELEEKHGIKGMQNMGPDTSQLPKEMQSGFVRLPAAEAARKATLARVAESEVASTNAVGQKKPNSLKTKKKVAFAEDLDVVLETTPQASSKNVSRNASELVDLVDPIKDSIVERRLSTDSADRTQSIGVVTGKKPSKFKATRGATPQTPLFPPSPSSQLGQQRLNSKQRSTIPPHTTHLDRIVERDITTKPSPPAPDEIDEAIHRQEIAGEYYKLRNRMIQRQGGFVEGEADNYGEEITPLPIVDEDGKVKKISRFKAARLK